MTVFTAIVKLDMKRTKKEYKIFEIKLNENIFESEKNLRVKTEQLIRHFLGSLFRNIIY